MKKLLALTIITGSSIVMATGCSRPATSALANTTVYGTVHGGYIGSSNVSITDGKISSVLIDETMTVELANSKNFKEVSQATALSAFSAKTSKAVLEVVVTANAESCHTYASEDDRLIVKAAITDPASAGTCATGELFKPTKAGTFYFNSNSTHTGTLTGYTFASKNIDVINSKRESYKHAWAYWAGTATAATNQGWVRNITAIENFFIGKTWNDIKDIELFVKGDATGGMPVTGATANDVNHYAQMTKLAAKRAFGK